MNLPAAESLSGTPMKIAVAINPAASFGRSRDAGHEAVGFIRAAGWGVVVLEAESYGALRCLVERTLAAGVAALVVVGGDGMVHLGVNALAGMDIPLGIVPTGTGNDVARLLMLPLNDTSAACGRLLEALGKGGRRIDAGRVTAGGEVTYFAGVLSAGFDAAVNERANSWSWPRGKSRYNLAMLRELGSFRPITYTVTADDVTWHQPALLISVANGRSIGGGMMITPEAVADDGWLDMFVVKPLSRLRFLAVFPKVFAGKHTNHPAVEIRRVRKVRLEAEGVVAYADGERIAALPVDVDVIPAGLWVLA
ncbi:diacylglycerol/lipid kinase family protein [Paenarthrobacter aurescens]|uniref:diacylglycerol/lipid kinase family protein n=1 Tax=Paenarthrobacter aurescens TaxID=43663 RepID=UPI001FE39B3D|nr:diacylglycerol kinase family protein [Paenarthrobacter aurescens]MDO6144136.1 diacylglycerol kinase [Paenarthrobacter aurescens]MDO6147983.1 diacylglycerol kinase [Paenarthrobacter aurescens]MDO6159227.1 diacylglycerol kinase [Paenarthrobacter aurescens]MDO6163211.1 diacylglycerol kinase [Paenarthrobacter aurescens]